MAPETSPRPLPRPGEGGDLHRLFAAFDPSALRAQARDWIDTAGGWVDTAGGWPVWLAGAVAGLVVMFGLRRVAGLRARRRRPCRWTRTRRQTRGTLTRWRCGTCGAEAFSHDGRPPKDCKRDLRVAPL